MTLRKTRPFAFAVILALGLSACGSARRAGKDISVVALSPVIIPYGGFTDGFTAAKEVRDGLDGGPAAQVLALPFTTAFHLGKHAVWSVIHALDFVGFPIYGAAELHPYGPEVQPLDYYTGTIFDKPEDRASSTDAESGVETEKTTER